MLAYFVAPNEKATLFVKSQAFKAGAGNVNNEVQYTLDGTAIFSIFAVNAARALTTDAIPVPAGTNLANVRVRGIAAWISGAATSADLDVYEAWVEVS